jgi:hypothetical protein
VSFANGTRVRILRAYCAANVGQTGVVEKRVDEANSLVRISTGEHAGSLWCILDESVEEEVVS